MKCQLNSRIARPSGALLLCLLFLTQHCSGSPSLRNATINSHPTDNQRQLKPRIVGGKDAKVGTYPFFGFWYGGECGCTLISKEVFLTAAHCVALSDGLGHVMLHTNEQPNTFYVDKIQVHPDYNHNVEEPKWDFALLFISGSVPEHIAQPVPLNTDDTYLTTPAEMAFLTTMGYGALYEGSPDWADALQEVTTVYVPTFPTCQRAYDNDVTDAELCAGNYFEGGQDACQGKPTVVVRQGIYYALSSESFSSSLSVL